jgi:flagellar FliL protein
MATAAVAEAAPDAGAAPRAGRKKLIIIIAAVLLLLAVGGAAALMLLKGKAQDDEDDLDDDAPAATASASGRKGAPAAPVYLPMDVFTVNLADRDADRFAQVGITLEVPDAKASDQIKAHMPAVRNRILLAIADRTAAELSTRQGKEQLAETVRRETLRALGVPLPAAGETAEEPGAQRPRRRAAEGPLPVEAVHFSNFIVQ